MLIRLRIAIVFGLVNLLLCLPIAVLLPTTIPVVQAATDSSQLHCPLSSSDPQTTAESGQTSAVPDYDIPENLTPEDFGGDPSLAFLSKASVEHAANSVEILSELSSVGIPYSDNSGWTVCAVNLNNILQGFHISESSSTFLRLVSNINGSNPKIAFKNPQDQWALTGEPCRKYLADGTCDETLGADGNPLYYDDIYWQTPDGKHHWDAPKADSRILQSLVYLVTPISEGGAGHEYVQVGKIIQDSQKDKDFQNANQTADQAAAAEQDVSSHYWDHDNPEHPNRIAQSMELTQIDKVRITTRITEKHRIGGDKKTYEYKSFPINVAWQSDQGIAQSPLPQMTNIYNGSLQSVTGSFGQLLDSLDLEASVDPSSVDINSISSLTKYVGDTLLTSLLQGGSLKGFDLGSTLDGFGRSFLAFKLGLPKSALSRGDTVDEVIKNIGQSVAEQNLGLPIGSLDGANSAEIYQNMGAKFFENVFKVSPGTLTKSHVTNQDQLLQALGRGKIEQQYGLKPGALTGLSNSGQLLKLNFKTQQLFTDKYASLVDDDLALTYAASPLTQKYNLNAGSFDNLTSRLIKSQTDLTSYELLVGLRAWDSTIGQFSSSPPPNDSSASQATHDGTCNLNYGSSNDGGPDLGSCIGSVTGSTLAPYILQRFGINLDPLAKQAGNLLNDGNKLFNKLLNGPTHNFSLGVDPNQIIQEAMASPAAQQLLTTKALTPDKLQTLVSAATSIVTAGIAQKNNVKTKATELAQAPAQLQLASGLKSILSDAANNLNSHITPAQADDSYLPGEEFRTSFTLVNDMIQLGDSDLTRGASILASQGQSAQSAALDLPGPLSQLDPNGQVLSQPLLVTDPVTALGQGDLSGLAAIGKLVLAKKLSSDKLTQYSFASQLQTDLSPSFGRISTALAPLIDTSKLQGFGFTGDDFSKIFQKDLSPQVFDRVGRQALLKAVWNISGAANKVNDAISSSPALQQVASTLDTINSDITFYVSHWQQLQSIAQQLSQQPSNLIPDALKTQIKQEGSNQNQAQRITDGSSNLQTLINQINANTDTLRSLVSQANLLINEIIAGHDLSLNQSPSSSNISISASGCWSQLLLRNDLINGKAKMQEVTVSIGACQLETSLNLPVGSILNFYQKAKSGGAITLEDFEWSVGKADFGSNNFPTYQEAVTRGKQVLERKGISTLVQQIPGVSSALDKVGLNAESIFGLIQGQSEPVSITLGGYTLDTKLQLPSGTMKNVAKPDCGQTPCTTEGAKDSRLQSLAKAGMKKLANSLQMPGSFDITGKGDFSTNYGKSFLSENLGLATNSFDGPFSQLLTKNAPETVLDSFGLQQTAFDSNLLGLKSNLREAYTKYASDSGATSTISAMFGSIDNRLKSDQSALIAAMQDGNSMLYYPDPTPSNYQSFALPFVKGYADTLKEINSFANGQNSLQAIVKPYLDQQPGSDGLIAQIGTYQQRLSGLDSTYSLQPGTFAKYILGKIDASAINQAVGSSQAGNKLAGEAISKLLGNGNNPILLDIVNGLPTLTKSDSCPNGVTVGDLLLGTNQYSGCKASSVAHIDLAQLLSGNDTNSKQARGFLYDSLLARTFGAKLEESMKLPTGTIRNFALNPRQAPEIALTTGLNLVANQLFKLNEKDDNFVTEAKFALKTAFLTGFYDVTTNQYTYSFDAKRSLGPLTASLHQMEQQELNNVSKQYLGTTISINDLHGILSGDPNGLLFVGLQRFAFSVNQQLDKQSAKDPRAAAFQINYADIRNSVAFGPATPEEYYREYYVGASNSLNNALKDGDAHGDLHCEEDPQFCIDISASENDPAAQQRLIDSIDNNPNRQYLAYSLDQDGRVAQANYDKTRKVRAQKNLEYQMYDIAAFQLDKNIPPGFAHAMFDGNSAERSNLIAQFAFNALKINDSSLGQFISASEFGSLVQYVKGGFKAADANNLTQGAVDGIGNWATDQFQKKFNVELPPGTMAGIIGWASTGFSRSQFSSAKITQGPLACNTGASCKFSTITPIGSVIKDWGEAKLFAWGDKVLGFKAGDTYKIYKSVNTYLKAARAASNAAKAAASAEKAYKLAETTKDAAQISSTAIASIKAGESSQAAQAASKQGEASAISVVINIVFAKQIGQAETQLGLVPGSGALAVNMLVDMLFGNPLAIVDLAIFIGMNLFGVYKTIVDTSGTADGYYPYKGNFGDSGFADESKGETFQAPSSLGYQIGEFNPRSEDSYRGGVKKAAQAKIEGVMSDLLLFNSRWGAAQGIDPNKLYISQVFTLRQEDLQQNDYLISQPSPRDNPPGNGYGPLVERTNKITYDETKQQWVADPNGQRFGYFFDPLFWNQIHVRW